MVNKNGFEIFFFTSVGTSAPYYLYYYFVYVYWESNSVFYGSKTFKNGVLHVINNINICFFLFQIKLIYDHADSLVENHNVICSYNYYTHIENS